MPGFLIVYFCQDISREKNDNSLVHNVTRPLQLVKLA